MSFDKTKPTNNGLIINLPGQLRANWAAIESRAESSLKITNAMCHTSMALDDSKLETIVSAGKVNGSALFNLSNIPTSAGNIPAANLSNAITSSGAQTISGVKTFTSFPVTPSSAPTTNYQAVNKKYVDDQIMYVGALESTDTHQEGGTGATLTRNTIYQASVDGEITGYSTKMSDSSSAIHLFTDDENPPTKDIQYIRCDTSDGSNGGVGSSVIVKKGQYWKWYTGTSSGETSIFFTPLEAT